MREKLFVVIHEGYGLAHNKRWSPKMFECVFVFFFPQHYETHINGI